MSEKDFAVEQIAAFYYPSSENGQLVLRVGPVHKVTPKVVTLEFFHEDTSTGGLDPYYKSFSYNKIVKV